MIQNLSLTIKSPEKNVRKISGQAQNDKLKNKS